MEEQTAVTTPIVSDPQFQREAEHFALLMSQRSVEELMDMFKCSRQLAIENKLRYESFFDSEERVPAILTYYGQAYMRKSRSLTFLRTNVAARPRASQR